MKEVYIRQQWIGSQLKSATRAYFSSIKFISEPKKVEEVEVEERFQTYLWHFFLIIEQS